MLIGFLKHFDKKIIYGFILSGIGFLYVGFAWTDLQALVVNAIQAIGFLMSISLLFCINLFQDETVILFNSLGKFFR